MDVHGEGESEESSRKPAAAVGSVAGHLENIPVDFIQKLYDNVPRRVNEVCKAKGFHTKY